MLMNKLFSYGTLQLNQVQEATFGRLLTGAPEVLTGFRIGKVRITNSAVLKASGQEYHPILEYTGKREDTVEGTLYDLTDAELRLADSYEVDAYTRKEVTFASGTKGFAYLSAEKLPGYKTR